MPLSKDELEKIEAEATERVEAERLAREKALAKIETRRKIQNLRGKQKEEEEEEEEEEPKAKPRKHVKGGEDVSEAVLEELTGLKTRHPELFKDPLPPSKEGKNGEDDKTKNICHDPFCLDPFCSKTHVAS